MLGFSSLLSLLPLLFLTVARVRCWSFLTVIIEQDNYSPLVISEIYNGRRKIAADASSIADVQTASLQWDVIGDSTIFCLQHARWFNTSLLMNRCMTDLVPIIKYVEHSELYWNLPLFVTLSSDPGLHETAGYVAFNYHELAGVVFLRRDSLVLRHKLFEVLCARFLNISVADKHDLRKVLIPESSSNASSNSDYLNLELYRGTSYLDELEQAVESEDAFQRFKAHNPIDYTDSVQALNIWQVFFSFWYTKSRMNAMLAALAKLFGRHPSMHGHILPLALLDNCIGSPATVHIQLKRDADSDHEGTSRSLTVDISLVQVRYILESALLEQAFGGSTGLRYGRMHVLEIGGGYGGMAVTLQYLYDISKYSIVDLPIAGKLQSKYVAAIAAVATTVEHAAFATTGGVSLSILSAASTEVVSSDLLVSFFAISELRRDIIDRYIQLYLRHARNGYLQLNTDELEANDTEATHLYSTLDLFRAVYEVHPHAVLLPPPSFHYYHRIVWRYEDSAAASNSSTTAWF